MKNKLKLLAETAEDLLVVSAALQDAIVKIASVRFDKGRQILHLQASRFCHEQDKPERRQCALAIYNALEVKSRAINRSSPDAYMVLLSFDHEISSPAPSCIIRLIFAGGGEIMVKCDALELRLVDMQDGRDTDKIPLHPSE